MKLVLSAGIALSAFLALSSLSSVASPCGAAAAVSLSLLSAVFISYMLKRKPTKHAMLVHDEEFAEGHVQGRQQRGLGSTGEEVMAVAAAAAAAALEPNRSSPAIDQCAELNQDKSKLAPDQTSEISIYGSESEDWISLSSYSSDNDGEDVDSLIEISFSQQIRHKEDNALNDNEEDSLLELDISVGFVKKTMEEEEREGKLPGQLLDPPVCFPGV